MTLNIGKQKALDSGFVLVLDLLIVWSHWIEKIEPRTFNPHDEYLDVRQLARHNQLFTWSNYNGLGILRDRHS